MDEIKSKLLDIVDENILIDKYMDDNFLSYVYDDNLYSFVLEKIELLNSYIKMRLYQLRYFILTKDIDFDKYKEISLIIDLLLDLPNKYLDNIIKYNESIDKNSNLFIESHNNIDLYLKRLGINL